MKPLVSICCLTYNHEPYIKQCLESFIIQITNFSFEVLIHDDASIDGTQKIINYYEKKYPQIIKPIYQKENQYSKGIGVTRVFQFPRALGKYIAMCEGDDYWTDPNKLQKQVDFLETNPDYGLVHTDFDMYYQHNGIVKQNYHRNATPVCVGNIFENLLVENSIATLTVLFKSDLLNTIDLDQISGFKMGDKFLWMEFARQTKIGYINQSTAGYRILPQSASNHFGGSKRNVFISSSCKMNYYFIDKYGCSLKTQEKVYSKALKTWFSLNERDHFNKSYTRLKKINRLKTSDRLKYTVMNVSFISYLHQLYKKSKLFLKKLIVWV